MGFLFHVVYRLITSGRDGTLRVWNFNNGHCRRIYKKGREPRRLQRLTLSFLLANKKEITSITYMNINRNCHVVAVGWDRRINIFPVKPIYCLMIDVMVFS